MVDSFSKIFSRLPTDAAEETAAEGPAQIATRLAPLLEHFPISRKVSYYPEFQKANQMPTLVLGYCVNNLFVFSKEEIRVDQGEQGPRVLLTINGEEKRLSRLVNFYLVVPHPGADEKKWDYSSRADLGKRGLFSRGNNISLVSYNRDEIPAFMDTTIARFMRLKEGYYANVDIALLEPQFESFAMVNQRRSHRVQTEVPAIVTIEGLGREIACSLVDFTEESTRLKFDEFEATLELFRGNQALRLRFTLEVEGAARNFELACKVARKYEDSIVLNYSGMVSRGELKRIELLDLLEIKSLLLQHGT